MAVPPPKSRLRISTHLHRRENGSAAAAGGARPERRRNEPQVVSVVRATRSQRTRQAAGAARWNRQGPPEEPSAIAPTRDWEGSCPGQGRAQHDVEVAFINPTSALAETARLPFLRPYPAGVNIAETRTGAYLRSVEISGPHDPSGPGQSPSRDRIFTCRPTRSLDEAGCARTILTTLARRAYRRPVTDADVEPLLAFYSEGRKSGGFDEGVEWALKRLLVGPEFLIRVEADSPDARPNTSHRISDLELASRLSFFLWNSIPDDELLTLAARKQLSNAAILTKQIRRMTAMNSARVARSPRTSAARSSTCGIRSAVVPVQQSFPISTRRCGRHSAAETELFFESIVREDRSALDLLRADYTFVNERLARHYGIPNVTGSRFRRVTLGPDLHRSGLLGQGSILTVTSYPDRTSPVVRGKWILENLLGAPPPAPPPNVPELKPTSFATHLLSIPAIGMVTIAKNPRRARAATR